LGGSARAASLCATRGAGEAHAAHKARKTTRLTRRELKRVLMSASGDRGVSSRGQSDQGIRAQAAAQHHPRSGAAYANSFGRFALQSIQSVARRQEEPVRVSILIAASVV